MTLAEAIKDFTQVAKMWSASENDDFRECAKVQMTIVKWLKELKQLRKQTRWIPVTKRLPEKMGTYLVTLEYKEHGKGTTTLWYHGKGIGWDLRVADVVTAWMPMPEGYRASFEEISEIIDKEITERSEE